MLTDEEAMELMTEDMAIDLPIKHESKPYLMIPLPDGATNGDIIKALFPRIDDNFSNVIDLKLWWNAKYKAGSEDKE